jgi:hypothetical protein
VFKYLESRDVDEVGYTLRTASLMTDPEYFFDDHEPSDYRLFGIRYLILPAGVDLPPVRARLAMCSGPYCLWTIDGAGYLQAGQVVGEISANRTNVGASSRPVLGSGLAADGAYLGVRYGSGGGEDGRLPTVRSQSSGRLGQRGTCRPRGRRGLRRRCGCAVPESRCSARPTTPGGRQP